MYFEFYKIIFLGELISIIKGRERQCDLNVPRLIAKAEQKSVLGMWFRMMHSLLFTGCTFKEYYNLNFVKRTISNQKTFITTGSNLKAYSKLNNKSLYHIYINKDEFNSKYSDFIARDWIMLSRNKEDVYSFFKSHNDVIIKPKNGDSGKGIKIIHDCNRLTTAEIDALISENGEGIAEELLYNHAELNELNASSLNTMRIITFRNGAQMDILFAGIRFGAKGCEIDNISRGGRIAPIDVETGKICGQSNTKKTVTTNNEINDDHTGFQMPMWDELKEYLYKLTAVVPQMRYMAWDIAITNRGFVTIEGNHSSGNTVIQAHLGETQQGLRIKLNELIKQTKVS